LLFSFPDVFHMILKRSLISRKYPGFREEIKLRRIQRSHMIKKFAKLVLPAKQIHSRKMINTLMILKLYKSIIESLAGSVHPVDVEVIIFGIPVKSMGDVC